MFGGGDHRRARNTVRPAPTCFVHSGLITATPQFAHQLHLLDTRLMKWCKVNAPGAPRARSAHTMTLITPFEAEEGVLQACSAAFVNLTAADVPEAAAGTAAGAPYSAGSTSAEVPAPELEPAAPSAGDALGRSGVAADEFAGFVDAQVAETGPFSPQAAAIPPAAPSAAPGLMRASTAIGPMTRPTKKQR